MNKKLESRRATSNNNQGIQVNIFLNMILKLIEISSLAFLIDPDCLCSLVAGVATATGQHGQPTHRTLNGEQPPAKSEQYSEDQSETESAQQQQPGGHVDEPVASDAAPSQSAKLVSDVLPTAADSADRCPRQHDAPVPDALPADSSKCVDTINIHFFVLQFCRSLRLRPIMELFIIKNLNRNTKWR